MILAVGLNPRSRSDIDVLAASAANEPKRNHSSVANATEIICLSLPWVETHG